MLLEILLLVKAPLCKPCVITTANVFACSISEIPGACSIHLQYAKESLAATLVSAAPKLNCSSLAVSQTFTHGLPISHIFV